MKRTEQLNSKLTELELDQAQDINDKFFNGELNKSDLGRFLIKTALEYLASAKVEKRSIITVNGQPVIEV